MATNNEENEEEKFELEETKQLTNQQNEPDILESMLQHVGGWGVYQKFLVGSLLPFGVLFSVVYFVQMFVTATPQNYWCRVPELEHLEQELRRNLSAPRSDKDWPWDRCRTYDANWTEVLESLTPPLPNTSLVPCGDGWEFQLGDIPYQTVVSERGWVCNHASYILKAQVLFFVGAIVGGLQFGWLADRFGRVPAFIGANMLAFVGSIFTISTTGFWDFAFCRLLVGIANDSSFFLLYVLVFEYVAVKHHIKAVYMSTGLYFSIGCLMLPWLTNWVGNWRTLIILTSSPMLIALLTPLFIPESIRWFLSRGRIHQSAEVLRKFERINGAKIPEDAMYKFIITAGRKAKTDESIATLLNSRHLRLMVVLLLTSFIASRAALDGLVRMAGNLGANFFFAFTMTAVTDLPSVVIVAYLVDKWSKKYLTIAPALIAGVISALTTLVPLGMFRVLLVTLARLSINISYVALIQWTMDLLPPSTKISGTWVLHVLGHFGCVMSPVIVYSHTFWRPLPLLILAVASVIAGGAAWLLPETKGRPPPQNVADSERIFKEHFTELQKRFA